MKTKRRGFLAAAAVGVSTLFTKSADAALLNPTRRQFHVCTPQGLKIILFDKIEPGMKIVQYDYFRGRIQGIEAFYVVGVKKVGRKTPYLECDDVCHINCVEHPSSALRRGTARIYR